MPQYLWQHPNWTAFRWDAARVLPVLSSVRRAQGHLLGRATGLGVNLGCELHGETVILDALRTSAVEGQTLQPESVRSSVARQLGLPSAGLPVASRQVDGLVEMLLDATRPPCAPLTKGRLWAWHAGLFPTGYSGISPITVGGWRLGPEPMRVVSGGLDGQTVHFEAPPSERVAEEMGCFLKWWNTPDVEIDGLIRAAVAQLWLLTIHPFDDGNGRIARAVTDRALAQDDRSVVRLYSVSSQIASDRAGYYRELKAAQRGDGELTDWLLWSLTVIERAIAVAERRMDEVLARAGFWERIGGISLSERQVKVVRRLVQAGPEGFLGGLSTRKYVALTRASRATAQREIADLVRKGLLKARPQGGRSASYDLRW